MDKLKEWFAKLDNWRNALMIIALVFMVVGWVQTVRDLPKRVTSLEENNLYNTELLKALVRVQCRQDFANTTLSGVDCKSFLDRK